MTTMTYDDNDDEEDKDEAKMKTIMLLLNTLSEDGPEKGKLISRQHKIQE